jgi:REP element-mobilizing transposase RayT
MSRWHNRYLDAHAHFCTATISGWRPVLVDEALDVLYREWNAAREALGVRVLAYVAMPEHFHLLLWAEQGRSVRRFLQRTLGLTSHLLQPGGGLWKERPRVLPVSSGRLLQVKVDYLHDNPLRRGLAPGPADWEHSSYRQLVLGSAEVPFTCDSWEGISL